MSLRVKLGGCLQVGGEEGQGYNCTTVEVKIVKNPIKRKINKND